MGRLPTADCRWAGVRAAARVQASPQLAAPHHRAPSAAGRAQQQPQEEPQQELAPPLAVAAAACRNRQCCWALPAALCGARLLPRPFSCTPSRARAPGTRSQAPPDAQPVRAGQLRRRGGCCRCFQMWRSVAETRCAQRKRDQGRDGDKGEPSRPNAIPLSLHAPIALLATLQHILHTAAAAPSRQ